MPDLYDVIIVGAGPGGATAAYFLGEARLRVLVIEKETLPRYKPCGGGLSARMLKETFPFSFEPVIETQVKAVAYTFGGRAHVIPVPGGEVLTVMRDQFDAHLLAQARAEVWPGVSVRNVIELEDRVVVETGGGKTVESRYLIGADGANSVVARARGLRRGKTTAAAIEAEVWVASDVRQRVGDALWFIFGDIRHGYAWVFPKSDHLSVGIAALHPKHGELQAGLSRVAARYGISLEGAQLRGHPIPIYVRREAISTVRALLVGDAAGLADPFTGEGIRLAIKSGRIAAESIIAGRPGQYASRIHNEIGVCHTFGLGVAWLFYTFPRLCFMLGAPNPFITYAFVDMLSDRVSYPQVILQTIASLPVFAVTEIAGAFAGLFGGPKGVSHVSRPHPINRRPCRQPRRIPARPPLPPAPRLRPATMGRDSTARRPPGLHARHPSRGRTAPHVYPARRTRARRGVHLW